LRHCHEAIHRSNYVTTAFYCHIFLSDSLIIGTVDAV
jgi:hypothetical protein